MSLGKPEAKKDVLGLYKARVKESLPWIASPLKGLQGRDFKAFHVRHEASLVELFFDLFFVANLATFTAVHEITTGATLRAYIGFFVILWSTWFQITIFDVRFAQDSVFERACKLYQFMAFVVLAAVGANFDPGEKEANDNYRIYQSLSVVLGITRILMALQYLVVACYVVPRHQNVRLPFILLVTVFLVSGGALIGLEPFFKLDGVNPTSISWWIVLPAEATAVISISSFWRMLSFKESHLNERLSLLTIIIIGEGVIGVTKGVEKMWPTDSTPSSGAVIDVLSIVALLFLLWQTYFDNHPHGHYGTIKQQWWALAHFFLHLGYVGVVEGSNQMAIFNYSLNRLYDLEAQMIQLCTENVTNSAFVQTLSDSFEAAHVDEYDSLGHNIVQQIFENITDGQVNRADLCNSNDNAISTFWDLYGYMARGYMAKFGIQPPRDNGTYANTFQTTYTYYWASVVLTLLVLLVFLVIIRGRYRRDIFEIIRIAWRAVMILISAGLASVSLNDTTFYNYVSSPTVVLTVVTLMTLTVLVDRVCRFFGTRRFMKHYQTPADEKHDHRHEAPHSTIISPLTMLTSSMIAYSSLDPNLHDSMGANARPPHSRESSLQSQVYGDYPVYGSTADGHDVGAHSHQQTTVNADTYGAPDGPYELLRM